MHERVFAVYIMTNRKNGVLYIGVTSNLTLRNAQHKNGIYKGFASKYNCDKLVYYELFGSAELAIRREKRLKEWQRQWKIDLIDKSNPEWLDLSGKIAGDTAVEPRYDELQAL